MSSAKKMSCHCRRCGTRTDFEISAEEMQKMRRSVPISQLDIPTSVKLMLIEHLCPECQEGN